MLAAAAATNTHSILRLCCLGRGLVQFWSSPSDRVEFGPRLGKQSRVGVTFLFFIHLAWSWEFLLFG